MARLSSEFEDLKQIREQKNTTAAIPDLAILLPDP